MIEEHVKKRNAAIRHGIIVFLCAVLLTLVWFLSAGSILSFDMLWRSQLVLQVILDVLCFKNFLSLGQGEGV